MSGTLYNKSSLPKGWVSVPLDNLTPKGKGITYGILKPGPFVQSGVPMLRVKDINSNLVDDSEIYMVSKGLDEEYKRTKLKAGEVLVSIQGTVGRVAIVPVRLSGSNVSRTLAVVTPLIPEFAKWIRFNLLSPFGQSAINKRIGGTTRASLNLRDLRLIDIRVAPLSEQYRIVAKIEELFTRLDAGVEDLKQVQAQLKRYRQSVLKAAVEGRLTAEWREQHKDVLEPADNLLERILKKRREKWEVEQLANYETEGKKPLANWKDKYKEPTPPDTEDLPELPEGWVWVTINQVGTVVSGQTPKRIKNISNTGNIPWYKVGDMNTAGNEKYMDLSQYNLTVNEAESLKLKIQQKGTVIFPKRGGAILTNKKRILSKESCYDLNTMGVRIESPCADYFWYWLMSIDLGSLSDGSNVPQINHSDIEPLMFPLPPKEEQEKIKEELKRLFSNIDETEMLIKSELKRSQSLRQSILKRAFEGKLVPQNPDDEPAPVMLEKIKAERAKPKKSKQLRLS